MNNSPRPRLTRWLLALLISAGTVAFIRLCLFMGVTSVGFSYVLNFSLMTWFTLVEAQLKPALSASYFAPHAFEREGRLYEWFGVHGYRWLLRAIGWERVSRRANPVQKSLSALKQFERATRVSETGHALIGLIVLAVTLFVTVRFSLSEARWLILFNIVLNLYPILVQRYNRPRLLRLIDRMESQPAGLAVATPSAGTGNRVRNTSH